MSKTMNKLPEKIQELNESIKILSQEKSFSNTQNVINNLVSLFGIESKNEWKLFTDSQGKIRSNAGWFMEAEGFADRRASYKISNDNLEKIDLKVYWVKKPKKSIISWLVALTPNFEDEPFYGNLNVGIDFVIPERSDKVIVVLSKNYVIRTLELSGELTITQQEIFSKWLQEFDFTNKAQVHEILWQSFDIEPLNKRFYKEVSSFFVELKQHLIKEKVFDDKHASYFVNRLIGRLVFCWFLDKKGIINDKIDYFNTSGKNSTEYYREKLETLFFKVFNTPIEDREKSIDNITPFLNGGLFEEKLGDKHGDPKLTFPADYFDRLVDFLHHYNFTTDESTSTFQQVAIDPEMLGRIFENLLAEQTEETGEQARKAKGAFYTPREIVDYMSRESLRQYLKNTLGDEGKSFELIDNLLDSKEHDWRDQQRNYRDKLKPYKYDILKALDEIKILDPACGSGAFPMGMLSLLLQTYERLDATFDSYKKKLEIIKNNLHGVDIEPMAVEISRLRAWLSIVVDEEVDSNKIKPLPNLDFKFVCANSLIPLDDTKQKQMFDEADDLEKQMQDIRDKYFNARSPQVKTALKEKFNKLLLTKNQGNLLGKSKKLEQLQSYHPFDNEQVAEFFDPKFMFGISGFDVVIGNPPYVSVKKITSKNKKSFSILFDTGKGRFNLFTLFLEKGQKLLKTDGILTFILPESLYTNSEYRHIRKYLLEKTQICTISNFSSRVFEAAVDTSVIVLKNKSKKDSSIQILLDLNKKITEIKQSDINDIILTKNSANINCIINKINSSSTTLSDIIEVQQGIIYSGQKKEDVFANEKVDENYKRVLDGRDIKKYLIEYDKKKENRYIKYTKKLHRPREERLFLAKEKIIFPRRSNSFVCTIDNDQFYLLNTAYICLQKNQKFSLKYLLAVLNSKVINFLYTKTYVGWQITMPAINNLPIPSISLEEQRPIINLVDTLLKTRKENSDADTSKLEEEIDQLVYKLYDLTDEEIKVIEESS
ncbi:MAG: TaqI-like C-terminal specificity domain-containing protein [Patescibacteria group bacterium]